MMVKLLIALVAGSAASLVCGTLTIHWKQKVRNGHRVWIAAAAAAAANTVKEQILCYVSVAMHIAADHAPQ